MNAADVIGVAAEDGALHVARADHVERHHQESFLAQPAPVLVHGPASSTMLRARRFPASSRFSTGMKWLLPEPNEPWR